MSAGFVGAVVSPFPWLATVAPTKKAPHGGSCGGPIVFGRRGAYVLFLDVFSFSRKKKRHTLWTARRFFSLGSRLLLMNFWWCGFSLALKSAEEDLVRCQTKR